MKKSLKIGKLFDFSYKAASLAVHRRKSPFCSAILAAGGSSTRMGQDKLMMELGGKPVIVYSLTALQTSEKVNEIIVVCREEMKAKITALCTVNNITKVSAFVAGGDSRFESVSNGLLHVSPKAELIAIHDAARPFADSAFITGIISAAKDSVGVIPAVPVKDTIKIVDNGVVSETPERSSLFSVQTPQVFDADIYKAAVANASGNEEITDDSMAVEAIGGKVSVVPGDERNIKLTTPTDFLFAEQLIRESNQ